jgi:hypothetical protein
VGGGRPSLATEAIGKWDLLAGAFGRTGGLEAGARSPSFETWDRICKLFGWPQTFASGISR